MLAREGLEQLVGGLAASGVWATREQVTTRTIGTPSETGVRIMSCPTELG
jgi:hypothetical protein